MKTKTLLLPIKALIVAVVAVLLIDLLAHTFLSTPNETKGYFVIKFLLYFFIALLYLIFFVKRTLKSALFTGIVASALFGTYYNILPKIVNYTTYGLSFKEITVMGIQNDFFVAVFFGLVHAIGFFTGIIVVKLGEFLYPNG